MTWADCVVEAIRYGWIDGQKKALDESSFLQRLSPRNPGSNWSSKNREHAKKLMQEGRMAPAGLAHVEAAQKDGRWEKAYAGSQAPKGKEILCHPEQAKSVLDLLPASFCQKAGNAGKTHDPNSVHVGQRDETALKSFTLRSL
ncbi:hypothetical protein ACPOL_2806 [Acidisarcina polymorpha]|uniref:Uncharacterized protein n=1 Tax=Acidisarcina polymorpha TaxID=2211140 RepID=A0A2Z5G024_9BACT|nr:hypothetical protein ACPOL_2806 [Acidisarcina polymorpha]